MLSPRCSGRCQPRPGRCSPISLRGVLFILALRGLSSPATSRAGNRFGMIGMAIAVVTTLVTHVPMLVE